MCKKTKTGKCEQCGKEDDDLMAFENDIYRCFDCMIIEGLCQDCGEYIPFLENENDLLIKLDNSSDFTPSVCLECFAE